MISDWISNLTFLGSDQMISRCVVISATYKLHGCKLFLHALCSSSHPRCWCSSRHKGAIWCPVRWSGYKIPRGSFQCVDLFLYFRTFVRMLFGGLETMKSLKLQLIFCFFLGPVQQEGVLCIVQTFFGQSAVVMLRVWSSSVKFPCRHWTPMIVQCLEAWT